MDSNLRPGCLNLQYNGQLRVNWALKFARNVGKTCFVPTENDSSRELVRSSLNSEKAIFTVSAAIFVIMVLLIEKLDGPDRPFAFPSVDSRQVIQLMVNAPDSWSKKMVTYNHN